MKTLLLPLPEGEGWGRGASRNELLLPRQPRQVLIRPAAAESTIEVHVRLQSIDELVVAPAPMAGRTEAQRPATHLGGEFAGASGAIAGEIDGVRPWREGDGDKSVHWASTLRSGELVVTRLTLQGMAADLADSVLLVSLFDASGRPIRTAAGAVDLDVPLGSPRP